jgi:hypothetical protein
MILQTTYDMDKAQQARRAALERALQRYVKMVARAGFALAASPLSYVGPIRPPDMLLAKRLVRIDL